MNSCFTIDGSEVLESHLAETCRNVLSGIQNIVPASALEGIVLGGGYGRGQGGVLKTAEGDKPYNDMEFYVFVRGNLFIANRKYRPALHAFGEKLSLGAGLHVEFKLDSLEKFRRSAVTMYSYDLVAGHKIIFGSEQIFAGCEHHLAADRIPDNEVARLLFNRCSGLLLARDFLRQGTLNADELDFVGRNLAKAQLAFGDAVLTLSGLYHWNCLERHQRLLKLKPIPLPPCFEDVRRHHAQGVEFKLHPRRTIQSREELETLFAELQNIGRSLWLWSESCRLNRQFDSVRDYALADARKCPATIGWRNGLISLRTFGPRALRSSGLFRYPRERLFNALALLLWDDEAATEPALTRRLQDWMLARTAQRQDLMFAYRGLWENYG